VIATLATHIDLVKGFDLQLIGLCGKGGAGKDTVHEHVLKPMGFLRWPMTLHYKAFLVGSGQATFEEAFFTKPTHVREKMQRQPTEQREEFGEELWASVFLTWMRALKEIVGIPVKKVAITDLRFMTEIYYLKQAGGKMLHLEAPIETSSIPPELQNHRSELEMDRAEIDMLRDAYLFNPKLGVEPLANQVFELLVNWGWVSCTAPSALTRICRPRRSWTGWSTRG
jgi:hypothetical protein